MLSTEESAAYWEAFRHGDAAALAALFEAYYDALYAYGTKLAADGELVKDCVQNLFQRLWQRRGHLRAVAVPKAYLFKALRRHLGDELATQRRHRYLFLAPADVFEVTYSPEELLIARQVDAAQQARLLAALNQLSKRQREAIYLKFFDGFSYDRIAEVMALNPQSVRNLVFDALKALRRVLLVLAALLGVLGGG